jgi:hypothetical protein
MRLRDDGTWDSRPPRCVRLARLAQRYGYQQIT